MKKIVLVLLCVFFMILDDTLMPFFAIRTFYPSMLLVFILCYSIVNGKWEGLFLGIFSGILQDIYFFNGFGINAFVNMLVCILAGILGERLFKERSFIPVISIFFISLIKISLVFILLFIVGQRTNPEMIFYNSIYGMFLGIFVYKRVYRLSQRPFMKREWKF